MGSAQFCYIISLLLNYATRRIIILLFYCSRLILILSYMRPRYAAQHIHTPTHLPTLQHTHSRTHAITPYPTPPLPRSSQITTPCPSPHWHPRYNAPPSTRAHLYPGTPVKSPCQGHTCSDYCIPKNSTGSYYCGCPDFHYLYSDNETCISS